jgi:hypothetical protein
MTPTIRVEGVDRAIAKLKAKLEKYKVDTVSELVRVGLMIQRESQENIKDDDLIDTGNMRASAFTVWTGGSPPRDVDFKEKSRKHPKAIVDTDMLQTVFDQTIREAYAEVNNGEDVQVTNKAAVIVGYGAYYALYVHEDGVSRQWTGAKFLERAVSTMSSKFGQMMLQGLKGNLR